MPILLSSTLGNILADPIRFVPASASKHPLVAEPSRAPLVRPEKLSTALNSGLPESYDEASLKLCVQDSPLQHSSAESLLPPGVSRKRKRTLEPSIASNNSAKRFRQVSDHEATDSGVSARCPNSTISGDRKHHDGSSPKFPVPVLLHRDRASGYVDPSEDRQVSKDTLDKKRQLLDRSWKTDRHLSKGFPSDEHQMGNISSHNDIHFPLSHLEKGNIPHLNIVNYSQRDKGTIIKRTITPKYIRARGLLNRSSSHCYRNASLQALSAIADFRLLISSHSCQKPKQCLACVFQRFFRVHFSHTGSKLPSHEPQELHHISRFIGGSFANIKHPRQEDAQEYISLVFERLCSRIVSGSSPDIKVALDYVFSGTKVTTLLCNNSRCKKLFRKTSSEHLLVLNIPNPKSKHREKTPTLEDCLHEYTKAERIDDYRCESCRELGIQKQVLFEKIPKTALISLSRFRNGRFGRSKDTTPVKFPELLTWDKFTRKGKASSRLLAIICHDSSSIHSGHYYAIIRIGDTQWLRYDDGDVTRLNCPLDDFRRSWYMLLYSQI